MLYEKLIRVLKDNNYEVYLIGGIVRDLLFGIDPDDIDLVTNATPEEIKKLFRGKYKVNYVGNSFGVSIVSDGNQKVDVATYRKEKSTGVKHRDFEIEFTDDLLLDIKRRDFTFNAMPMCPITCEVIDVFHGIKDLNNRLVRFVGDPDERIKDDPERMIRAPRMATCLEGDMAPETYDAIRRNIDLFHTISKDRLRHEILKTMKYRNASRFFYILYHVGLLELIFPSLAKCYNHPHGKHHFEDVFEHQMLVGDYISTKYPLIKLTGYLHDCGKPIAYQIHQDGSFIDHHIYGEEILRKELADLRFSSKEIDFIANLTRCHMLLRSKEYNKKTIRKALVKFNDRGLHYTHFLRLGLADKAGSLKRTFTKTEAKKLIRDIEACMFEEKTLFGIKDLDINGHDIMKLLKINPSPRIGNILNHLLEIVLEEPSLNQKEILIQIIKDLKL